ncbi:ArsR/SmtB family transcription factor [Virgibacillus ndiopensis]|uniref:ArsR/SmtB family transcription factor n=1 Tax=Virgibacillus ndiopensis TaxID=2004408 RepID=UPI000C076EB5|nr:helix-turn-helix domain-containing protein [Virgibacillus ndiopensis]
MRKLELSFDEALEVCKAMGNKHRMSILRLLSERPHNVNELSKKLGLPFSTTAVNVQKLEDANLITTELIPGRGTQKINKSSFDQIIVDIGPHENSRNDQIVTYDMPIGGYSDCTIEPSCGIVSEHDYIGVQDDPSSFFELDRNKAQLAFFRMGSLEYRFPNSNANGKNIEQLEFSAEICSEAPLHKLNWPSDITVWVNEVEIGTWTSPSDFGGERGFLTPDWWLTNHTQYGLLKNWKINKEGFFIEGVKQEGTKTIKDLTIEKKPYISFKIGIKEDAVNKGGLNLFGHKFGNHEQGIIMKLQYKNENKL